MKKLLILISLLLLVSTAFGGKILLSDPYVKGIDDEDAKTFVKALEKIYDAKFNHIKMRKIKGSVRKKLKRCSFDEACWSEKLSGKVDYVAVYSIEENEDVEIEVKSFIVSVEDEEVVDKKKVVFDDMDEITAASLWKRVVKGSLSDISGKIKGSSAREKRLERRRSLEKKREAERRRKRALAEKKRREEELERRRLEKEREKLEGEKRHRERERRRSAKSRKEKLKKNGRTLKKGRELVIEMCSGGDYTKAVKSIVKLGKLKCECEEDAKVLALKTQLLNFNKIRSKIIKGVKLLNSHMILDNLEAAKALDQEIVEDGTEFSQKIDKVYAIGYYARGLEMEKEERYLEAKESYEKCVEKDENKKECNEWLESREKLVKKLYDKSKVVRNFNPTKAKNLLRSVKKLVTAENKYYKLAEKALEEMDN